MNSFTPLGGKLKHDPLMMRKSPEQKKKGGGRELGSSGRGQRTVIPLSDGSEFGSFWWFLLGGEGSLRNGEATRV